MRHGTNGYAKHYRAGEKPCDVCRGAYNEQRRLRRVLGPLFRGTQTSDRIVEVLDMEGALSLRGVLDRVVGVRETVRRTVYRMEARGDITRNPVTLCYSVGSEEG